ncbi:hypothetical protein DV713_01410 [Parageobacillus thermoglucosidasius]|nr:hypothetical protein DV713_01410 [Parageobacillus thermoglucosidasius]
MEKETDAGKDAAGLSVDFTSVPSLIRWPKISFMNSVVRRLGKQLVLGKIETSSAFTLGPYCAELVTYEGNSAW